MATDVIIDPSTGQIYWNDSAGVGTESISIKGDAVNTISFTGYSGSFSPGSTPAGALTLVTIKDSAGTDALIPGTNGYNLGSSTLRWNTFATNANLSGTLVVSDLTNSSSTTTGTLKVSGGIGITGNAFIGGTVNLATPLSIPNGGTNVSSFGQTGGFIYYDGENIRLLAATGASINYSNGYYQFNNRVYASSFFAGGAQMPNGSGIAGRVTIWSGNNTIGSDAEFTYDTTNNILNVSGNINAIGFTASGVAITSVTASTSTTSGALVVAGGVGISGRLTFNQAAFGTTGIASNPTMAMIGQTGDPIYMSVLEDNSISFEGSQGQLFSISPNLTTGYIWSVNDISGVPFLRSSVGGTIGIAEFGGLVGIGQTNPIYKLDLKGNFGLASSNDSLYNFIFSNSAASGSNSLQIRSANSLLLYNSGNTFYTGFKSNAATNITYTLPTTDGSADQFLQTNGSGTLTWATATGSGGTGSTAGVGQGGQYEMAYYPGTGLSVIGSNTFTNNTATGAVSITHSTLSTDSSTGALKVTGGVGIGGSLYVGGIGASITGVTFSNSTITRGTWNGTVISPTYGGTGQNLGSSSGVLTISSGTVSASTTSSAILSAITDETGSGVLVFNTQPSFGTGVTTGSATFAVFNTNATAINAFGAATAISLGAATGKATFNSTDDSISSTTGSLVVSGGAGFAKSISVAGRLQLLNGANVTAFVSSGTGNTVYTLPATTPATGSSVLQSTAEGIMSWVPMVASSSSGAGSGTVAIPNAQYSVAYYAGTGASVSGSATFTNSTATGVVNISHATVSTTSATGALTVTGGVGIGGSLYVASPSEFESSVASINVGSGALVVIGGVGIGGSINVGGASRFSSSATAISIGTGALTVTGGAGIAGSLYVGEASRFTSSIASLNSGTGALTVTGGVGIGGSLNVALPSEFEATTAAIDVGSGALVVTGGVGIGGSLFVGGASRFTSSAVSISAGTGALTVTGGVGIGGSVFTSTSVPSSISGVVLNNGLVTIGTWSATAITAHYGGTGLQTPFVVGDILYATSTSAWGRLAASSTSGQVLTSNGSGNLPTYQAVPPAAASSVAVTPTLVNASFFIPVVNTDSGAAVGLSTVSTLVINPANHLVTLSGLAVTALTQTTSSVSGALVVTNGAAVGQTLSVGGSLNIFNGANYTGFRFTGSASTTYTLPIRTPTGTGTSYLSSSVDGVMAWVAAPTSGGSGSVNSGTATYAAFYASTTNAVSENANLQFTGAGVSVGGNIASSSTTTGSIYVFGGLGISGNAFIGGTVNISSTTPSNISNLLVSSNLSAAGGTFTTLLQAATIRALSGNTISFQTIDSTNSAQFSNVRFAVLYNTVSTSSGTGGLVVSGGAGVGGSLFVASASQFESSAASINVGSGALVVTGGVGIGGSVNVGGPSRFSSSATAISIGTGALTVTGGAGIAGSLYVGEASRFSSTIASLGSGTGALTITGGVGIGGSLYVANTSRFESSVISSSVGTGALTVTGGVGIGGSLYVGDSSRFTSSTIAISSGTGALTVTGGVGIGGSLYVANTSRFESSVISSSVGTGALTVTGGVGIGGSLYVGDSSRFTSSTIAISSGTGALTVTGGVGIGGSLYVANTSRFESSVISSSVGTGALVVAGGVGIGGSLFVGNASRFSSTNISSSSGTGALTVTGGVGIGGSLYVGDASRFESNINSITPGLGGLIATGGVGIGLSVSIGGRLQLFNGANYTAFVSSATGATVYILPPRTPTGTGTSYLSSSIDGVMAWVAAPTSGGSATPGGSNKQIQYNNSTAFGGAAGFEFTTGGIANTVSIFSASGTGYTAGLWIHAINGSTTRVGIGLSNPAFELEILGEISATNKSFVINHPTKSGMKLRYGSLEGPENGVYVRGELKGTNIIEVPDHWIGLVHEDSYTVHLTPISRYAQLYVKKIENYNVFVAENNNSYIHCYYSVWAERKDIPKLVTEYEAQ
jgi:hypothetical protein